VRCYLREGEGGGWGTGSDPLDGAAGERALHGCRWRESGDGEGQRRWEERKRGLAWLGSLLRAVPFGRGKREKSCGWTGSGGFACLWKRKKIRGKRKKKMIKERERKV
jgi:hypothetical protein